MSDELEYKLQNNLIDRLPNFQQGEKDLVDYLGVAGEFLDDFRQTINDLQYDNDYANVSSNKLLDLARNFGLEIPRNLDEDITRITIRDIIDIYRTNGTEKTLQWVFGVIGWRVELRYAWIMNPEEFSPSPQGQPIDLSIFYYGEEVVEEDGTYFYGEDLFKVEYSKIPIIGENYPKHAKRSTDKIAKTPYLFVEINAQDYNIFTEDVVDPDTGEVFSYTDSEIFEITRQLIEVFLFEKSRPATVSIVIIANVEDLSDDIRETYIEEDTVTVEPESQALEYSGGGAYGIIMDRYAHFDAYGQFKYTDESPNGTWYWNDPPEQHFTRTYLTGTSAGTQRRVPTNYKTTVSFNMNSNDSVNVYTTTDRRDVIADGNATWSLLETINSTTNHTIELEGYYSFYVEFLNDLNGDMVLDITHRKPTYG